MLNQRIKDFWIQIIDDLKQYKGVAPDLITENEGNATDNIWKNKLNQKQGWNNVRDYALEICEDIFTKGTQNPSVWDNDLGNFFTYLQDNGVNNQAWNNWDNVIFNTIYDYEAEIIATQAHLQVDDLNDLINDPKYTMPLSLEWAIFWLREFNDKVIVKNLEVFDIDPDTNLMIGINEDKVDSYIEAKDTINAITPHLGAVDLNTLATTLNNEGKTLTDYFLESGQLNRAVQNVLSNPLPADYPNQLNQLKTNSDEYTRIHTKLSGKVSDGELDNLLNNTPPPQCSHTDYDTIKSERDTLKTENTELKDKEKSAFEKLITDCNLGIDKSSNLEQIITKIKALTKTPDTSTEITELKQQKSQLETQLAEKEKTITELQTQKPTEEIKSKVIESSKELGLFSQSFEQKLSKVSSYQELSQLQQEAFKEKLLEKENSLQRIENNTKQLKVGLVVLIVFLVLGIAGAVGYFAKKKKSLGEKE